MGEPHGLRGLVAQLRGRLDELGEPGELGPVDAHVLAVAEDHPVHALGHRLHHVRQRDGDAVDGHLHLEVEPVGARRVGLSALAGREVDDRCAVELAVVGLPAGLLDLDLLAKPGQQLLGEQDGVRVAERVAVLQAELAAVGPAEVVGLLVVEHQRVEGRLLRLRSSYAAQASGLGQCVDPVVGADAVVPGPCDADLVGGHPGDREHQARLGRLGQHDRAVGGDDRDVPLQAGQVLGDEVVAVGGRHDEGVAEPEQPAQLRARRRGQRRQRHRPGVAVGQPQRDRVASLAEHVEVGGRVPLVAERGTDLQPGVLTGGAVDVEPQLDRSGQLDTAQARAGEDRDADVAGAAQQPHLVGSERAEGDVGVGAEVHLSGGRPVGRQQVVEGGCLLGRVTLPVEVGHGRPGDVGAHPVVAGTALHRAEPQGPPDRGRGGAAGRPAGVAPLPAGGRALQVELEGERLVLGAAGPLRALVELVEEGGQLPLPAPPVVG